MFFECEVFSIQEKTMRLDKQINVHPKVRGQALVIPFCKINEPQLTAACTAALALEGVHQKPDGG